MDILKQKITPFLWYDNQAEEAANYYVSIFKDSKITNVSRYDKEGAAVSGMPEGSVMTIEFEIAGQVFTALNGGPTFNFTPAISFVVSCETQQEIDDLWEKLSAGGETSQCGWLTDKFGVTWQIVPSILEKLMGGPDKKKSGRAMEAMLKMTKLDIDALKKAYEGA
ncbi:VOC family protein [Candidatus Falkowbacteria bacterium]|nr:VOC family protein [Candidatus Falkowbacteria bacterium]